MSNICSMRCEQMHMHILEKAQTHAPINLNTLQVWFNSETRVRNQIYNCQYAAQLIHSFHNFKKLQSLSFEKCTSEEKYSFYCTLAVEIRDLAQHCSILSCSAQCNNDPSDLMSFYMNSMPSRIWCMTFQSFSRFKTFNGQIIKWDNAPYCIYPYYWWMSWEILFTCSRIVNDLL